MEYASEKTTKMENKIQSFIYPEIDEKTRTYAGVAPIINPSGDWTNALTPFEEQQVNYVEPSDCYIQAQQSCIAILKEYIYGIKDEDYLADFNALLSEGTPTGGNPIKGALSIKKDGLIPQSMRDRTDLRSWQEYHSWKGMDKNKCISKGQEEATLWDKTFRVVVEKDMPLKTKYELLREELKRCPPAISVYAWAQRNGKYYKPEGVRDTHLVDAIVLKVTDNNEIVIKDTYKPFLKTLEANTDFEFAMGWSIRKRTPEEVQAIINNSWRNIFKSMLKLLNDFTSYLRNSKLGSALVEFIEASFGRK